MKQSIIYSIFLPKELILHTGPLKGGLPFKAIDSIPLLGQFPSIRHIQDVISGTYVRNAGAVLPQYARVKSHVNFSSPLSPCDFLTRLINFHHLLWALTKM